jgi:hypothetical protein
LSANLYRNKLPLHDSQRHLRLRRRTADDRVERLCYVLQAVEGDAEGDAVLEVGDCAGDAVEEDSNSRRDVFPERFCILSMLAGMPEESLVRKAPTLIVLAQHVDEGVHVQAGLLRAHAEHHAEVEENKYLTILSTTTYLLKLTRAT